MADRTNIEIEFPNAPKVSDRPERQAEFEQWYYDMKTSLIRQFEQLGDAIDALKKSP